MIMKMGSGTHILIKNLNAIKKSDLFVRGQKNILFIDLIIKIRIINFK